MLTSPSFWLCSSSKNPFNVTVQFALCMEALDMAHMEHVRSPTSLAG